MTYSKKRNLNPILVLIAVTQKLLISFKEDFFLKTLIHIQNPNASMIAHQSYWITKVSKKLGRNTCSESV